MEIASLFTQPGRYLRILDGPRMSLPDWTNEVIRRSNALAMGGGRQVIFADLSSDAAEHLSRNWASGSFTAVEQIAEEEELTGCGARQACADFLIWCTVQKKQENKTPLIILECKSDNVTIKPADYAPADRADTTQVSRRPRTSWCNKHSGSQNQKTLLFAGPV